MAPHDWPDAAGAGRLWVPDLAFLVIPADAGPPSGNVDACFKVWVPAPGGSKVPHLNADPAFAMAIFSQSLSFFLALYRFFPLRVASREDRARRGSEAGIQPPKQKGRLTG